MPTLRGALLGALLGVVGAVLVTVGLVLLESTRSAGEENVALAYSPLILLVLGAGGLLGGAGLGALAGLLAAQLSPAGTLSRQGRRAGALVAAVGGAFAGLSLGPWFGPGLVLAALGAAATGAIVWRVMPWVVGSPEIDPDPADPGPPVPTRTGRVLLALGLAAVGFVVGAVAGGTGAEAVTGDRDVADVSALVVAVALAAVGAAIGWRRARR